MAARRTKARLEEALAEMEGRLAEYQTRVKAHKGKDALQLMADVDRLASTNRHLNEDLAHEKRRVENELKNVASLTEHMLLKTRQLAMLKSLIDYDRMDVEELIDTILEKA